MPEQITTAAELDALPPAEAIAEALLQYETGGLCHYGKTCGLCDCGRAEQTPERQRDWDEHQLDRARAVMALIPPQRCAPRPNIRKGSIMNGELPELHDPNWITGRSLDQKLADWESLAKRGQVHDGNQAVLDLVGQVREHLRLDAPTTVKPNGEAVPEQRCAPSEDELANVLRDIIVRVFEQDKDIVAQDAARAVLALFADQHTVAQVKAEAWNEGYTSGHSRAMRRMSDEPGVPDAVNPYRADAIESGVDQ